MRFEAEGAGEPDIPSAVVFADGEVGELWEEGIAAFDEAIEYAECVDDGGAGCPSIDWELVGAGDRGQCYRSATVRRLPACSSRLPSVPI